MDGPDWRVGGIAMLKSREMWVGVVAGAILTMLVVAGVTTVMTVQAQPAMRPLTALDYAEIQQLVARYSFALDSGADDGYAYADLFAPDGSFGNTKGRDQLAASAKPGGGHYPRGPEFVFHYTSNHVIEATPEGARGRVYVVEVDAGERGKKPALIEDGGHYSDTYVKTAQGWRFKTRTFIKTKPGTPPVQKK
jgi:hypothetical protein